MFSLIVVRHAKARSETEGMQDWDRTLDLQGEREAHEIGSRLRSRGVRPQLILSSPAIRARTTARIIAEDIGVELNSIREEERLYLASPNDILKVIREYAGTATPLTLVGHNPGISEFADRISLERRVGSLPTCGVFSCEIDIEDWAELEWSTGLNSQLDYPEGVASR